MMRAAVSAERLEREIRARHFAILATSGLDGRADSAAVSYAARREGRSLVLYVMTRRHLRKARDIAADPRVSLVIPLPRRFLWFVPDATIQVDGRAELLAQDDARGNEAFDGFFLGRRIQAAYRTSYARGERRICFLRITLEGVARSYMLGAGLWQVLRRMESGSAITRLMT